eukprot:1157510-Pelagomonas_calceolata.AAC.27
MGSIRCQSATGVPEMATSLLWPLAAFLRAPDTLNMIFIECKVNLSHYRHLACTSKSDCTFFTGILLEAYCAWQTPRFQKVSPDFDLAISQERMGVLGPKIQPLEVPHNGDTPRERNACNK